MGSSEARISIDTGSITGTIDPRVYGLHVEHIWNCVYPSIWVGGSSAIPNDNGIRLDVAKLLAGLKPTVCKYPGGYFSDFYDWRDGVGSNRPARVCPTQPGRRESNEFGTAEFVRFCRLIGAEPFISVNTTSIQPSDAAHWVEYCNGDGDTYWANRRREDGFAEPFNVKYWAIGNEQYWLHPAAEYAARYKMWSHWMRNADPSIAIVMSGLEQGLESLSSGPWNLDGTWASEAARLTGSGHSLFPAVWHQSDPDRETLYSIHPYFSAKPQPTPREYAAAFAELERRLPRAIRLTCALLDEFRGDAPRPRLCFDEYGLIHEGTRMDGNMTQAAPFWAALWLACFLQICHEHPGEVGMATHPGPVNMEHELVLVDGDKAIATPSYHAFRMMRAHAGGQATAVQVSDAPLLGGTARGVLWACTSMHDDGKTAVVSVVNLSLDADVAGRISFDGAGVAGAEGEELCAPDTAAENTFDGTVSIAPSKVSPQLGAGEMTHTFPKHSLTVFRVSLSA